VPLRRRVHDALAGERPGPTAQVVRFGLATLIIVNVAVIVLESVPHVAAEWARTFAGIELFSVAVFSVEYLARLWTAPEAPRFATPVTGRLRWMLTPGALVDLASILPSLLLLADLDLRVLRIVRLSRLVRIAKLGRYSLAVQTLQRVLRNKATDLLTLVFLLLVMLVVSSAAMYQLENAAQPEVFSSIPATMWWGIITLTTIGYGDMSPVTGWGRVLGGCIAVLGIGMFALPAGLLGAAFVEELGKARRQHEAAGAAGEPVCPHCGKPLPR